MKVLQICNKPPFPPADGGAIAMGGITRSMMMNGYDVTILSMVSFKHNANENDFPDELRKKVKLNFAKVDLQLKPFKALLNLFSSRSYHAERFYSKQVEEKLISILKSAEYDIIHIDTIFPMVYYETIRQYSNAKIVVRPHNIEHEVWQTTAKAERNTFKKWYLTLLARRLKSFEEDALKKADGIITISSADFEKNKSLKSEAQASNIPLGVDLTKYPVSNSKNVFPCLFHLGAMDWIPNQQGMSWFLETAWKTLSEKYPRLKFFIAGRKMPEKFFRRKEERLIVEGEIDDPLQFMQSKDIMVVPLLSGSGIRVKIIEGMALGKTIVTTSIGAAGIDCKDGENILIADSPEDFVKKISKCIDTPQMIPEIGMNARTLVEAKYSLKITSRQLDEFYQKLNASHTPSKSKIQT